MLKGLTFGRGCRLAGTISKRRSKRSAEVLSRGTVYANLTVKRSNSASVVRINEDVLGSVLKSRCRFVVQDRRGRPEH